ncbi:MAG: DNA primase, partial [Syntrophothermus sp.]
GVNMIGLCPFHNEKTPSFTVSPAKGIFKCFGCGKAGNSVHFMMEYEHFTYPEALKYLAKKYQIEIEEEEVTPEKIAEQNERDALFMLNQFAQKYFEENLFEKEEGKAIGLTYFHERGFDDDTIRKFQLGYSINTWDDFSKHARDEGYKTDYLVKTGLSVQKEEGRLIDRFHGRVIFPIHSPSGRIIGFGGRILTADKHAAKYLNSPESEIYNKSKTLYGIFLAKTEIIRKDNCYLVEGYTDVISMHQAGIKNVVASSGTSLTHDQVKLIHRHTSNITILYDGDPAGIKASMRGIDMIVEQGMNVKIVLFPEGEDPDSFCRKRRPAEVEEFIERNAVNFILFKAKLLLEETAGDPVKKAGLIREIVSTIALIPDGISRSIFVKECSSMMNVPEQTLHNELNKIIRQNIQKKSKGEGDETEIPEPVVIAPTQEETDTDTTDYQEKEIIRLLLTYGNETIQFPQKDEDGEEVTIPIKVAQLICGDLKNDELGFDIPFCQRIFEETSEMLEKDVIPDKDFYLQHSDPVISTQAVNLMLVPYELSPHWAENHINVVLEHEQLFKTVEHALLIFKGKKIEMMIKELYLKMQNFPKEGDPSEMDILLGQLKSLQEKRVMIQQNELGRTIIK